MLFLLQNHFWSPIWNKQRNQSLKTKRAWESIRPCIRFHPSGKIGGKSKPPDNSLKICQVFCDTNRLKSIWSFSWNMLGLLSATESNLRWYHFSFMKDKSKNCHPELVSGYPRCWNKFSMTLLFVVYFKEPNWYLRWNLRPKTPVCMLCLSDKTDNTICKTMDWESVHSE